MIRALALCAIGATAPANAAEYNFCWLGGSGYTMTGHIGFPDSLDGKAMITERDVTSFEITGFERGVKIGYWSLQTKGYGDTWHLRFDPSTLTFPTGGSFPDEASQGWNADGVVENCGDKGFGFNSGNYAQDICLYGVWMKQSSIRPDTPLTATTNAVTPDCREADMTS